MANPEHFAVFKQAVFQKNVKIWNDWRIQHPKIKPDLSGLVLSGVKIWEEWKVQHPEFTPLPREVISTSANLNGINFDDTFLGAAVLLEASLQSASFKKAELVMATLKGANLYGANLEGTNLNGANLYGANLSKVSLVRAYAEGTDFSYAHLDQANLSYGTFNDSVFKGANLSEANLTAALLRRANMENAELYRANLTATDLGVVKLSGANLSEAILTNKSGVGPLVFNTVWGDALLSNTDWSVVKVTFNEYFAKQAEVDGVSKDKETRQKEYKYAAFTNRQLSLKLAEQGLTADAARFSYNYQICYREYLKFSRKVEKRKLSKVRICGQWLYSCFLWLLSGYGYKIGRAISWYLGTIITFGFLYWLEMGFNTNFNWENPFYAVRDLCYSVVESVNVFHGRGISSPIANNFSTWLMYATASIEAGWALIIEVTFIAVLTQKFFGK